MLSIFLYLENEPEQVEKVKFITKFEATKDTYPLIWNSRIYDTINLTRPTKNKVYEPKVCVVDSDQEHAKNVIKTLREAFAGEIYKLDFQEFLTAVHDYDFCDIFSVSVALTEPLSNQQIKQFKTFFNKWGGVLVMAAGNDETKKVEEEQYLAELKKISLDQVIIVGEAELKENEIVYANVAYGELVDIVIPSRGIYIDDERRGGTSYATPIVAGTAAQILERHGILSPEKIKARIIDSDYFIEDDKGYRYPVLNMKKAVK